MHDVLPAGRQQCTELQREQMRQMSTTENDRLLGDLFESVDQTP